jgi:cyclic dehypoxanthinyl futalosine synthase
LRMLAASRLFLDNFVHVQASWFSEGKKAGQAALHFGSDDFGGTLYEENVHAEAGFVNTATLSEIVTLIHEAGFDAVQRTTKYELVKKYPKGLPFIHQTEGEEISLRKNAPAETALSK